MGPTTVLVPLEVSGGLPQIEVTLNGQGPYKFLVHPGVPVTGIKEKLAKELSLEGEETGESTAEARRVVIR